MGIAMVMVYAHGSLVAQKTGMMARIICTAAIYERVCCDLLLVVTLTISSNV